VRQRSPGSAADPATCFTAAVRILAGRELSAFQLRERLKRRGFPDSEVTDAVKRLTASGSLDDRRVAFSFARHQLTIKRRGRLRALRELESIGIARDLAREAVAEAFDATDESALIDQTIARRVKSSAPLDLKAARRLHGYLIRQGFSADAVARALRRHGRALDDD
jgi:regulatory protein